MPSPWTQQTIDDELNTGFTNLLATSEGLLSGAFKTQLTTYELSSASNSCAAHEWKDHEARHLTPRITEVATSQPHLGSTSSPMKGLFTMGSSPLSEEPTRRPGWGEGCIAMCSSSAASFAFVMWDVLPIFFSGLLSTLIRRFPGRSPLWGRVAWCSGACQAPHPQLLPRGCQALCNCWV
ncbi:uncharacterized protein EI90DRAFT_2089801 [Cantharellus anzutake]|uniref:uncharacterized protein n=1 Tax=Cantharellus anzutake TaxID=1750568 RepID=UPI0019042411|nr:uncharacterized protein EI90DRAFT_2089801 [Cantharellus anzutake]KAF8340627.1 hypothetical protein EI90DRAFT_2089801 [Cantharellus anzutake]